MEIFPMSKSLDLSGIGQHGHDVGTRVKPAIDGTELRASHDAASKRSEVHEYDAQDQKDATGDLGRFTSVSDREQDFATKNAEQGHEDLGAQNVRNTPSGAPKNSGGAR